MVQRAGIRVAPFALLVVAITGCGTTVGGGLVGASPSGLAPSAAAPSAVTAPQVEAAATTKAAGTSTSVPGSGESIGSTAVGAPGIAQIPGQPSGRLPGLTASTLSVGFLYQTNTGAGAAALGVKGVSFGDQKVQTEAVVSWINRHGGVAGRALRLVPFNYSSTGDGPTQMQAACAAWTQDDHVAVGLATANPTSRALAQCLAKSGAIVVGSSYAVGSRHVFAELQGHYYAPSSIETVSVGRTYVDGLARHGFFTPGAKIGVLYLSFSDTVDQFRLGMVPALRAHGLPLAASYEVGGGTGWSDIGPTLQQIQSAELRFRAAGVTHVLFADLGGTLSINFMQYAESQHYRGFRYGLTSASGPAPLAAQGNSEQLVGSMGVGWKPAMDVGMNPPRNGARDRCLSIMKAAHQPAQSPSDLEGQLDRCSQLFFLKTALDATAADVSVGAIARAVGRLGTTPTTAAAGLTDVFRPGVPWGGATYRPLAFRTSCGCFEYSGPEQPISR